MNPRNQASGSTRHQNPPRLVHGKRPAVAENVAKFCEPRGRHRGNPSARQQIHVSLWTPPEFLRHHVRAQKCRVNVERMLLMKIVENLQNLQLAFPIQSVTALRFDGGSAVRREFAKVLQRPSFQHPSSCATQMFHRRANSAARARNLFIGCAGDPLLVFGGAAKRKNQVCVRIDKAGKNNASAAIQLFRASRFPQPFDAAIRAHRRDVIVMHQNRTVANNFKFAKRAPAPWHRTAQRQNLRAPRNQPVRHGCDDTASLRGKHYCRGSKEDFTRPRLEQGTPERILPSRTTRSSLAWYFPPSASPAA